MPDETQSSGTETQSLAGLSNQSTQSQQGNAASNGASVQTQSSQGGTTGQEQAGQKTQTQQAGQQQQQQTQSQNNQVARPSYVPEQFWDATAGKVKEADFNSHLTALQTRVAADDVRRNSLPTSPEAYKAELPADLKLPDGVTFKLDETNPALIETRKAALEMGLDQQQFSKLLGLHAGALAQQQTSFKAARDAEIAKLGPAAPARVDAVTTWLKAMDGSADKGDAKALTGMLWTARAVEAFENLIKRFSSQGAGSFTNASRDGEHTPAGKVSDEEFAKMPARERLDYARKFDQRQFTNGASR